MGIERLLHDHERLDRMSADQVLLNDALQNLGRAGMIPRTVRIDQGNRTALADAQTIGFGAINAAAASQIEFIEPLFQIVPRGQAGIAVTAFGLCLIAAQENVSAGVGDAQFFGDFLPT